MHIFTFMKNQIQFSLIIFGGVAATIIIRFFMSYNHEPIQKKLATFIWTSTTIRSNNRYMEKKNWLHIKTFSPSEIRDCMLNITNRDSNKLFLGGNSIIRNLMTDLTEIANSQNHVDYSVYKRKCAQDAGGSYVKNCNFTDILGASRNKSVVRINLE